MDFAVKVHGKSKEPIALLQAFSNHYGWPIHFARSNSPQDKAIVEKRIKDFYAFIYPKAQELYFDSYDDLNEWLGVMAIEFNKIKTQGEQCSPYDKYLDYEKEALMKVEVPPFNSLLECKRCKVPTDYYLKVDDHFYMVPYDLKGTWVRFEFTIYQQALFKHEKTQRKNHLFMLNELQIRQPAYVLDEISYLITKMKA